MKVTELKNWELAEKLKGKIFGLYTEKMEVVTPEVEDIFKYLVKDEEKEVFSVEVNKHSYLPENGKFAEKIALLNQRLPRIVFLLQKIASGRDEGSNRLEAGNILREVFG